MPSASKPQTEKSTEFVCPECGRTFTRAAGLGAHRRHAHNVVGAASQSAAQAAKPATKTSPTETASRRRRTRTKKTAAPARRSSAPSNGGVNRDALLQTLFPNGIPAKESVIRSVNSWLDEAERLSRLP